MGTGDFREYYIDPRTDFGFKYLFGTELNKDLLIGFLNALFHGTRVITDVKYLSNEHLGTALDTREAIFDVYCESESGERFIVEMQNVFQRFFKDRSIFYSTFPIREQAKRGEWDFRLDAVYTIGILNFVFDEDRESSDYYHHEVKLMDVETKKVFYDKLTFIYLELPKFTRGEDELETLFDKWMYVLKNLSRLLARPAALQERIFTRLFEAAEIARFSPGQLREYEDSVKAYRDVVNAVNTAKEEGLAEGLAKGLERGREEEKLEIARQMKLSGLPDELILKCTGVEPNDLDELLTSGK
ncbi:Rpn family recombination-promoting nuclease/putative transposase [Butyricimonas synergistica]|uniref:Rpn family recombination-promoting nuclease/putative transposase n=1 Tax=Butyricimonas synergistica TaxID=544644 RepID=UPI00037D3F58|nr:Rpn family recombination-promoting nuclease/putative transposase [Butyricimonas synergistica]